jgi:hypothetical protein
VSDDSVNTTRGGSAEPAKTGRQRAQTPCCCPSRDVEMIGVLTSPAIDAVGSKKGHIRLAAGCQQRCSRHDDVSPANPQ